ncbi:hypothetical protein T484DRAFT_1901431 [Baffinella frigidus]|nr:hypothetical protein T484DRAFT_1901431 [Cryptophyta sp. CCMP2293]
MPEQGHRERSCALYTQTEHQGAPRQIQGLKKTWDSPEEGCGQEGGAERSSGELLARAGEGPREEGEGRGEGERPSDASSPPRIGRRRILDGRCEGAGKRGVGEKVNWEEERHEASAPRGEDREQWAGDIGPMVRAGAVGRSERARGARITARGSAPILLPLRGVADERLLPGREDGAMKFALLRMGNGRMSMLPFGQNGVADSLCAPNDTPQPHESNYSETYDSKITNSVLDPRTGVSISYDAVNLVPLS